MVLDSIVEAQLREEYSIPHWITIEDAAVQVILWVIRELTGHLCAECGSDRSSEASFDALCEACVELRQKQS